METFKLNLKIITIASIFGMFTLSFNSEQDKTENPFYYAFDEKVQIDQLADKLLLRKNQHCKSPAMRSLQNSSLAK